MREERGGRREEGEGGEDREGRGVFFSFPFLLDEGSPLSILKRAFLGSLSSDLETRSRCRPRIAPLERVDERQERTREERLLYFVFHTTISLLIALPLLSLSLSLDPDLEKKKYSIKE